jgi:hypothetical protein
MHAARESPEDGFKIPNGKNHREGIDKIVRLSDSAVRTSKEVKTFLIDDQFKLINYQDIKKEQLNFDLA